MKKTFLLIQEIGKQFTSHSFHLTENSSFTKRILVIVFCCLFALGKSNAQIINEGFEESQWITVFTNTTSGSVSVSGVASNMTYYINSKSSNSYLTSSTNYTGTYESSLAFSDLMTSYSAYTLSLTSSGLNTSPNTGTWWYSRGITTYDSKLSRTHSAFRGWNMASSGYLITPVISRGIVTVNFWEGGSTSGNTFIGINTATNNLLPPSYRSNSTSNGFTSGVSSMSISGGIGMNSYSYSTSLTSPAQIGLFNVVPGTIYIDDIIVSLDSGTQASVITNSATASQTSIQVTGSIVANNPLPNALIISSGVCYSLSSINNNPDTSSYKTTDGPIAGIVGSINSNIKGLIPNTNYCVRTYAITSAGIIYGNTICTKTTAPTNPVLTTNVITILSSSSAQCGGNISDSGGLNITSSGVCWSTSPAPTVANNKTVDGNSTSYTSTINGLLPCTQYYVRAYAVNANGISYGNELNFTTSCVPTLSCNTTLLNFGSLGIGTSTTLSFTLTGSLLSPAAGNITLNAPVGYLIWTTGIPANSLSIPYTGGAINIVINVKYTATKYGYSNDSITCTGGGTLSPNAQTLQIKAYGSSLLDIPNNSGLDFWTGFGYVAEMRNNAASMSVYIAAKDQDAVVNVDIPGLNWNDSANPITIPAHTVYEVKGFPTTTPDSRLYYTGVSNRGVHIQSINSVPVSVWTYTSITNSSAAGCMNIPSNTWSSDYVVQSFGGYSNNTYPNSYFFVIAQDDNTQVTITPSADIVDSSANTIFKDNTAAYIKYPAYIPFTVNLNKGQVFTGMSILSGTGSGINSYSAHSADLSGTKISSNSPNKIAVFGGNGRCIVDTSVTQDTIGNFQTVRATTGSDNLMQQMIPSTAWGTKYLTIPTKTMEDNYYRVYIQDTTTKVTVNGILLNKNSLVKNLYYQLSGSNISKGDIKPYDANGNHFLAINSDKAISVCQFIVAGAIASYNNILATNIGNNGGGDPEMIILSPIKQAISSVTVATPNFKNGTAGGNYINVVIPKAGVKSFKIYSDTTNLSWGSWKHSVDSAYLADPVNNLPFNPIDSINVNNYAYKFFNDTTAMLVDTGASSYITGAAYKSANTLTYLDKAFIPYPSDSTYYFARFKLRMLNTYTMTSNVGFNAIAYGMDAGESYGFNAGTNIKDLSSPSTTISISGNIKHPSNGNLIPSVTSNMAGITIQSMVGTGNYTFSNLPSNSSVKIKLTKNNDKTKANGVSTIDAALIQSHVLGKALLNSPYKIIAADVNGDDKVSALDIVFLKRLILGLDTTFTKGSEKRMWVFVDSNYTFSAPTSPFPYKDSINFAGLSVSKTSQTFLGMKLGDVNWDWNQAIAKPYNQKVNAVELSYHADALETSSHYVRIPVMVKNFKEMMGMQFTLSFNADLLKYKGMEGNMLNIETGTNHTNEGKLSMLWLDPKNELKTLEDGTQLMVLVFENIGKEAIGKEAIGNTIELDGSITSMEAFDKDYNLHGLIMKPIPTNLSENKEFIVIAPNPVTDGNINVQMQLSQNKTITIRLVDISGRIIFKNKVEGSKGLNSFILNSNKKNKLTTGEYYLQVIGIDGSTIKKVMIQ